MIKIKVSARGGSFSPNISQFVGNSENTYQNCRFYINDSLEEADVWFVMEDVDEEDSQCLVSPDRVFFLTAETSWMPNHYYSSTNSRRFIDQFSQLYTCHDVYKSNVVNTYPFLPWMINANHGQTVLGEHDRNINVMREINNLPKTKPLSVFCSAQVSTSNHRMRFRFVHELKSYFGKNIDWYGNGVNPLAEKWDGIAPYRYTLALENQSVHNLFTEKIYDAFLGLAYPIYWGAPNLSDYFDEDSFQHINIRDLNGSIRIISNLIESDVAEASQIKLVQSRDAVLDKYNMFVRMANIAQEAVTNEFGQRQKQLIRLETISSRDLSKFRGGVRGVLGRTLVRAGKTIASQAKNNGSEYMP